MSTAVNRDLSLLIDWCFALICMESRSISMYCTIPVLLTCYLHNSGWVVDDGFHCRFRVVTGARDEAVVARYYCQQGGAAVCSLDPV